MIYLWRCTGCNFHVEVERPIAQCNVQPGPGTKCECRGEESEGFPTWQRVYEAPIIMQASYPDGIKRKGWAELKESAKLEKLAAVAKPETKAEIKREILKLGVKPGKD